MIWDELGADDASSYDKPPLDDIALDEFERFAIDRLRILSEIEAALVRNRTYDELKSIVKTQGEKYLPLHANTAKGPEKAEERRKDHIGHFVLRLAFCRSYVVHNTATASHNVYNTERSCADALSRWKRFCSVHDMKPTIQRRGKPSWTRETLGVSRCEFNANLQFCILMIIYQLSPEEERDKQLMSDLRDVHPDEISWYKVSTT